MSIPEYIFIFYQSNMYVGILLLDGIIYIVYK